MKYCTQCGSEINENAVICIKCGCNVNGTIIIPANRVYEQDDNPSTGLAVLAFFFPMIGCIIFLVKKKTSPKKAISCATGVAISLIASWIFSIIYIIIIFAVAGSSFFDLFGNFYY